MRYPIDTEQYIAVMRAQIGHAEELEELFRTDVIPIMNAAYFAGKVDEPGYPKDPDAVISAFEKENGPLHDGSKRIVTAMIREENVAYAQGQQDAKDAAGAG